MGQWPLIFNLEEDKDIQEYNMDLLIAAGYTPMCAGTLAEGPASAGGGVQPRLYLLDGSGIDFCRELREKGAAGPWCGIAVNY